MDKIIEVYDCLKDEKSKELFEICALYSITGNEKYIGYLGERANLTDTGEIIKSIYRRNITNMIQDSRAEVGKYIDKLQEYSQVVVCGAGINAKRLLNYLDRTDRLIFCDKKAEIQTYYLEGIKVIPYKDLVQPEYKDSIVFISTADYYDEIKQKLINIGIDKKRIVFLDMRTREQYLKLLHFDFDFYRCDNLTWNTYFDEKFLIPGDSEVFIDAGFYDGYTSRRFIEWCKGNYKKIIAFEPDKANYERYKREFDDIDRLELYNSGVWNKEDDLRFKSCGGGTSYVGEDGEEIIHVKRIDDVVGDDGCTFIKMDIEGGEIKALEGAKETIKKFHPKLAVSIYHRAEDVFEIPLYIKELYAGYKFYIRHYTFERADTVLYAIADY